MFVALRCVILSGDLKFSRRLKSGLDETRRVTAIAFTSPENALSHIQTSPQDIIIVDAENFDYDVRTVYEKLISEQPKLGFLILSGQQSDSQDNSALRSTPRHTRVRDMLPILESIKAVLDSELSDTTTKSLSDDEVDTSTLLTDLHEDADFTPLPQASQGSVEDKVTPSSDATFQKLAQEEPPLPDDATISDLQKSLIQQGQTEYTSSRPSIPVQEQISDSTPTPASLILESTAGDTTPLDQLAIETFVRNLEDKLAGLVRPLPSWERAADHANHEPTFLEAVSSDEPLEYTSGTTLPSDATRSETYDEGQYTATELQVPVQRTHPVADDDLNPEDAIENDLDAVAEDSTSSVPELVDSSATIDAGINESPLDNLALDDDDDPLIMSQPITPIIDADFGDGDSQLVQIASVITQMSLETAASATALMWQQQIIAVAGDMPRSDIDELFEQEPRLLEPTDLPQKMFFVTLNSSGVNYMVMMMPTVDELLLVLIFSGNQPLGTIRRQTSRLINALATVPETIKSIPTDSHVAAEVMTDVAVQEGPEQVDIASPVDTDRVDDDTDVPAPPEVVVEDSAPVQIPEQDWGKRQSYTFIWVLKDNQQTLLPSVVESLSQQLDHHYIQQGWQIEQIDVREDYIQMQANVPGEMPPHNYVYDLMQSSADFARTTAKSAPDATTMWADSYLILSPARQLETAEIQRFLNFVRG